MHQERCVFKHLLAIATIAVASGSAYVYSNPYSVHRLIVASYDEFDTTPNSDGKVVLAQKKTVDFRLPNPTLTPASIAEIRDAIGARKCLDSELVADCVALVRRRLNTTDSRMPNAATANAETLYRNGTGLLCLCGEHAVLLNEVLQACELQSRVLWLEGHVTAEYFDRDLHHWVFIDPHMNVLFRDASGNPVSAARLIYATERNHTIVPLPICAEDGNSHSLTHGEVDHLWYRNVLLNGECYALSGSTLRDPSRWSHIVRFRELPQMLVLATQYDSSHAKYIESFSPRKCALIGVVFFTGFYVLVRLLRRTNRT